MAAITAELVRELREKTGAGMMECKKALVDANGHLETAIENLRKKGIATALKKAGRLASEGLIEIYHQGPVAAIVEINSETDFVAKTEDFQNFIKQIAKHIAEQKPSDIDALLRQTLEGTSKDIDTVTKELVGKIGENISIRRFTVLQAKPGEQIGSYTHMGNKIGSLVRVKAGDQVTSEVLRDLSMHVAAAAPRFLKREDIPQEVKDKEREIYLAQLKDSGKPVEMLNKIIDGKLSKFAGEICFVDQIFIKDPTGKATVAKHLASFEPNAEILEFVRFQVGEGLAKKDENFAEEVAKQLG